MSEADSLGESVVNSVPKSALLRSASDSSSLVKTGNGSMNGTGSCIVDDEVEPAAAAAAVAVHSHERPSTIQSGLMSETESLAELVVNSVTNSALLRSISSNINLINTRHGSMHGTGHFPVEHELEASTAPPVVEAHELPASTKSVLMSETESLAELVVNSVTKSALLRSTSDSSSLIKAENGSMNGIGSGIVDDEVKPAAAAPAVAVHSHERPGTAQSGLMSETESLAELVVNSVTQSALLRSASDNSSLIKAGNGSMYGTGSGIVEDEVEPAAAASVLDADERPSATQLGLMSETESLAELVVHSVTTSAVLSLTPSDNSLIKDGVGSMNSVGNGAAGNGVELAVDATLNAENQAAPVKNFVQDEAETLTGITVHDVAASVLQNSTGSVFKASKETGPLSGSSVGKRFTPRKDGGKEISKFLSNGPNNRSRKRSRDDAGSNRTDRKDATATRVVATVANNRGGRPASRLSLTSHMTGISHDAPAAYKDGGRTTFSNGSSTRNSRCGSLDVDVDIGQHEPGLKTVGDGIAKPEEHGNRQHQTVHPARLFHLLWQRDRSRCPFSRCPIPDTVVFNSMGEAADWFFTSKREGGIKRKLTSNTLFSNIFREFCKGSTDGDPVAVTISWIPRNDDGIMSVTSDGVGRDIQPGVADARPQQHLQKPASPQPQHAKCHHPQLENQQDAAIRHLTARELHDFLYGSNHHQHPVPPVVEAATGGKQQRNEAFNGEEVDAFHTIGRGSLLHLQARSDGGTGIYTETFARRHIKRSEAAATAAGAGAGDRDSGGWCLLQKYIGPTGTRNSTLRCHWSAVSSHTPARVRSAHPEVVERHRFRLGSVEEIEKSFRERSPDRSPFRQRLSDQSVPKQSVKETAGLELGAAERLSSSGSVYNGCLLERSTNVFRADRKDLPCEHRCVTFEEPPPSSRGGLWPRSVREPMKSPALRQTVVEACTAALDHVSQVTRGEFRPKLATSYFRQGQDGRTYLMFFSRWAGQSPSLGIDANEPLLCRPGTGSATMPIHDSVGLDHQARLQHMIGMGVEPTVETTISPDREGSEGGLGALQEYGRPVLHGLVCPGCGRSGIRGGVRCDNNGSSTMDADTQVRGIAPSHPVMTQNTGPAVCCPSTNCNDAVANLGDCTGNDKVAAGEESSSRAPSLHALASTAFPPLDRTVYTSLGVVVDVCTWSETLRGGHAARNGDCGFMHNNGRRTIVRAGVKRCFRVLNRLHPGVRAETISVRCNEDLRLRLRRVSVCRECALEIAGASDVRLREMNDAAKRKMSELAARLGVTSSAPSLSERQRKARVSEDIKAFQRRFASASSEPSQTRTRLQNCFGGGPSRMGEVPIKQFGHVPKRPLGKRLGNRPSTTDGLSPRQQVFQHSPRKIVSATQPPGGFSFATKYHEEVRMTTPSTSKSAAENYFRNSNEGRANETTTSSALRHTSCGSDADGGSGGGSGGGGGGGGGDGSNEDRVGPDDGFNSSNECVGADENSAMNAWRDERDRHIQTRHEHKQQQQWPRQQQQQPEHTGITGWNFYDRPNIAFRSRRLLAAYSGTGIGDPGGGGVSPRGAGNARPAKVT
ncbi:unnamed protein product, partial [Ectocarpus sp. 8 AP-2014]